MDPGDWRAFLNEIADTCDEIALRHFRSATLRVDEKPNEGPVTDADRQIEATVRRLCAEHHPELGVFGEEEGETGAGRSLRLVVDPIDATRNFVRGIPIFATLLAVEVEKSIVAGLVSAPALSRRWSAARGFGAFAGGSRLKVSGIADLAEAQVFHGSLGGVEADSVPAGLLTLVRSSGRQRGFGDFYQHVLVAEGAGEVSVDPALAPWDAGPLLIIVEEAGGRATSIQGENSIYAGSLVCTNGQLHEAVLNLLRDDPEPLL